jgi:hypothetical protein
VEFEPQLEGDLLLKDYEQQCLWLGGTSESHAQLVNFIKDKCSCMLVCYCVLIHLYLL